MENKYWQCPKYPLGLGIDWVTVGGYYQEEAVYSRQGSNLHRVLRKKTVLSVKLRELFWPFGDRKSPKGYFVPKSLGRKDKLKTLHQVIPRAVQGLSEPCNNLYLRGPLSRFDEEDMATTDVSHLGELLLSQISLVSKAVDRLTKGFRDVSHPPTIRNWLDFVSVRMFTSRS